MTQEAMVQRARTRQEDGRQATARGVVMWEVEGCGGWLAFETARPSLLAVEERGKNNTTLKPLCSEQIFELVGGSAVLRIRLE